MLKMIIKSGKKKNRNFDDLVNFFFVVRKHVSKLTVNLKPGQNEIWWQISVSFFEECETFFGVFPQE